MEIRKYRSEDREKCINLFRKGLDPDFNIKRFEWLHQKNLLAPSQIAVAEKNSKIVGFYAAIKKHLIFEGKRFVGARDIDPVVSPDSRGQGVFTRLLEFALKNFKEIDFFYNFANPVSTRGFIKSGWHSIGPLKDYGFQTGVSNLSFKTMILYIATRLRAPKKSNGVIRELKFEHLDSQIGLTPQPPKERIWVERSLEYLKWRYHLNPLQQYQYFGSFHDDVINELLITKASAEDGIVRIMDFISFESENQRILKFLPLIVKTFKNMRIYLWNSTPSSLRQYFITNPFEKKRGQNFLVREFPGKIIPDNIYNLDNWFITHGDSEFF